MTTQAMTDYELFLESKKHKRILSGFDVDESELNPKLFDFQKFCVRRMLKMGKGAVFAGCGQGKSIVQLEWSQKVAEHEKKPVLILAPLSVSRQTIREGVKFGYKVDLYPNMTDTSKIVITNYEQLENVDVDKFCGVVLDECFAPGTPIEIYRNGTKMTIPISQCKEGDKVENCTGLDTVTAVKRKKVPYAIKLKYNGKEIICSPRHPFFTQRGWIPAVRLTKRDRIIKTSHAVRMVRKDVLPEMEDGLKTQVLLEILQCEMADVTERHQSESSHKGGSCENREEEISMVQKWKPDSTERVRENKEFEPDIIIGGEKENISKTERDAPPTFSAWGQWSRDDITAAVNAGCTYARLDSGIGYIFGEAKEGLPDVLQSRLRELQAETCDRVRWEQPPFEEDSGCKERQDAGFFRLESFEVLESGDSRLDKYRDEKGQLYFVDLSIKQHPSFTINGGLVHNSSILKNFTGHYRKLLTHLFKQTPYKLCCSATPSPNDLNELGNHSEFLDVLDAQDMRSKWFVREEGMNNYRLKGHAKADFYGWVASWAIMFENPADIGFKETGKLFILPKLNLIQHEITSKPKDGELFASGIVNATNFNAELRKTQTERLTEAARIARETEGQVLIWIKVNTDGDILRQLLPEAVEVRGSDSDKVKEQRLSDFADGKIRILISKAKICGYGMNFQNCGTQIFAAPDFSFEDFYQQVRRSYRFGRKGEVNIHLIIADNMANARVIIEKKQKAFEEMQREINRNINGRKYGLLDHYDYKEYRDDNVFLMKGDTTIEIKRVPDNSVDLIIYSPPFSSLFTYSNYINDMGNNDSHEEFFEQYTFLLKELYRILKPGRLMCVHTKDLGVYKNSAGYTGMYDFTGEHTRHVLENKFKLHSKITIWTDPVLEMQRTKTQRLLYKQVTQDSSKTGIGMAEYVTIFKKWEGDEKDYEPITNLNKQNFPLDVWQKWASPVWMDIKRTDVLNGSEGTAQGDEKHICLAKGSLVLTKRGYVPIETVEVGDETLTHMGRWRKVVAVACTGENKEVVKVNAQGVPNLICTPNHKIYSRKRELDWKNNLKSEAEWTEAKDIKGSYVNLQLPPVADSEISKQEWWIIGRWVADGHIDARGHQFFISVGKDKIHKFDEMADGFIGAVHDKTNECSTYQIGLINLSAKAREVLFKIGRGAKNKVLPYECISLNKELSKSFLDGYLSGDGCEKDGKIYATSVSRALMLGIAIVAQRVYGRACSVYAGRGERTNEIRGREIHCQQEWNLALSPKYTFSKMMADGNAWKPVYDVTETDNTDVYNIEVEEDHSYTAEGCIVKNCPLQLSVIHRLVNLWSNPGEVVFTPFLGIGSEVYEAIKCGRKGIGCELKDSYFDTAVRNIKKAEMEANQKTLFDAI